MPDTSPQEARTAHAIRILKAIGFPLGQGTEFGTDLRQRRVAHILMGVADLKPDQPFADTKYDGDGNAHAPRSRDLIRFINENYGESLSQGSYDDIRRKNLDYLVEAGLVVRSANRPGSNTNDGTRGYSIAREAVELFTKFGTAEWEDTAANWLSTKGSLSNKLSRERVLPRVPVKLPNGDEIHLSAGEHNLLQKAIVEEFLPRFLKKPELLYLGDSAKKILVHEEARLKEIGLGGFDHGLLPDVVAVDQARNWLYFIEAVHSCNPVTRLRQLNLEKLSEGSSLGRVYVSAFTERESFRKWICDLAWETEVWFASEPTHMIHFNGERFLGPHAAP